MKIKPIAFFVLSFVIVAGLKAASNPAYNYGEALQKAIYFYECQQSGPLPAWNRVQWRGPSDTHDGSDVGKDLTGGWHDAGDHVKFNFPMAYSVTMLCWGIVENRDAYVNSGQLSYYLANIRFATDYLIRCHTAANEFYGQVGDGGLDHSFWGPAESVESQMKRPSAKIDSAHPGSDLAGEAAAALAAASIVFMPTDPAYSATCLAHAKQLYAFADKYRGKYDASITGASGYYTSYSGYNDEIVWGAIWLFMAGGDSTYLTKAKNSYDSLSNEPQTTTKEYKWTIAWDDKSYGCYVLLAKLTGAQKYKDDAQRWLDFWTVGVNGQKITYTPGGLAWLDTWGVCRYAANTSFCALVYSDFITDASLKARYHDFAVSQINYILGNNPLKRSLVVGFGNNPPRHEHHRTADGVYPGQAADTQACVHTMFGALIGGPDASDNYTDQRSNYTQNEPACDYNAGFASALARLYKEYGGSPLTQFPPKDSVTQQFRVLAKVNASGTNFTEIDAVLCNMTNEPARVCRTLSYRYFVDLSEAIAAGIPVSSITVQTNYLQGNAKLSALTPYNGSGSIYYLEVSYYNDSLFPGTQDSYKREAQFRISLPQNAAASSWNTSNDWSYKTVGTSSPDTAVNIPVYDNEVQVWGAEPNKAPVSIQKSYPLNIQNSFVKVAFIGRNICVTMLNGKNAELSFVNINGRLLYRTFIKGSFIMDAKKLGSGACFAIVKSDDGTFVSKVIHPGL